ncbi:MAG: ABC transporter permease [Streptosporangiales bacterium]|nr:ABC transporter permease [Streptosporangiales bacterium]
MSTAVIPAHATSTAPQIRLWANEVGKGLRLAKRRWAMAVVGMLMNAAVYLGVNFFIGGGHVVEDLMIRTLPALMAVVIAAALAVEGAGGIAEEINGGTLEQTQLSPITAITSVLGRVTALALQGMAAAAVLWIGFVAAFGLQYAPHPSAIVPALLTLLDAMGYGLLIVAMTVRVASIGAITHVFNMVIMFFGGMIVPISVFPDALEAAARLIPTAVGVQALNTTLAGEPLSAAWADGTLPLLLVHTTVFVAIGLTVYARNIRKAKSEGGVSPR